MSAAGPVTGAMKPSVRVLPHVTSAVADEAGDFVLAPLVPAATTANASAARSRAGIDFFIQIPPSLVPPDETPFGVIGLPRSHERPGRRRDGRPRAPAWACRRRSRASARGTAGRGRTSPGPTA